MKKSHIALTVFLMVLLVAALTASTAFAAEGTLVLPKDTTVIEEQAFYGLPNVERIVLPDGVTAIGDAAFGGSESLLEVEVSPFLVEPDDAEAIAALEARLLAGSPNAHIVVRDGTDPSAFRYRIETDHVVIEKLLDETLTTIKIPGRIGGLPVTKIDVSAFSSNTTLTKVVIPEGVTTIGSYAFYYCYNLADVSFPSTLTSVGRYAFYQCGRDVGGDWAFVLPDKITEMDRSYFPFSYDAVIECKIGSVTMNTLLELGKTFCLDSNHSLVYGYGYYDGEKALFLDEYKGDKAALTSVTIPEGVVGIDYSVFDGCTNLTDIRLPGTLRQLNSRCFEYVGTNSETPFYIAMPDNLAKIDTSNYSPFRGCDFDKMVFECGMGTTVSHLLSNNNYRFTTRGNHDFRFLYKDYTEPTPEDSNHRESRLYMVKYTGAGGAVEIPEGTEVLGEYAFIASSSVEDHTVTGVTFPDSLIGLDRAAFYKCCALKRIEIPEGITAIPSSAFGYCTHLREIVIPETVTQIGDWAFSHCASEIDGPVYYKLPDYVQGYSYRPFADAGNVVPVARKDSHTAMWLGGQLPDEMQGEQYWFTDTDEYDFRYVYTSYQENNVTKYRLDLAKYVGEGTTAVIPAGPERIAGGAFADNAAVTKVVIFEGVTRIEDGAFRNCYSLTDIAFPSTLKTMKQNAFVNCGRDATKPFYFVLPDDMEDLSGRGGGAHTFSDCNAVLVCGKTSATAALLTERNYVFAAPGELDFRYRREKYTEGEESGTRLWLVGYTGTDTQVNIPQGIYGIKPFSSNTTDSSWRTFYGNAFMNNETVTKVTIPEGTVTIRANSFTNCYKLTDITFPSTLKTLDQKVFIKCGRDEAEPFYFALPNDMEDLSGRGGGAHTFESCKAVLETGKTSATAGLLSDKNYCYTVAGEHDFRYRYTSYDSSDPDRELWLVGYAGSGGTVTIPAGIYGIRRYQWNSPYGDYEPGFYGNTAIMKAVIPEGTVVVEDSAFRGCVNLTDITFPKSLKVLKNHAFEKCGYASETPHYFVLPDDMTEISTNTASGWGAFTDINMGRIACTAGSETARLVSEVYTNHYNGFYHFVLRGHETDGLLYRYEQRKNADNETEYRLVLRQYEGTSTEVTIPSGCGIYSIGENVFNGRSTLEKIVIPEGVVEIREGAFNGCSLWHMSELATVNGRECSVIRLPDTLKRVEGSVALAGVGVDYTERFYMVLPSSLQEIDIDMLRTCNAVFIAPSGSAAASKLYDAFFYFYNTLEEAASGTDSCQYKVEYDGEGHPVPHTYYGRP